MAIDLGEYREQLIYRVEGTAEWRTRKSEEYPDDERNIRSSRCLELLATNLRELPPDHPKLLRLWRLEFGFGDLDPALEPPEEELTDRVLEFSDSLSEELRQYGFQFDADGDPENFLSALISAYESNVRFRG